MKKSQLILLIIFFLITQKLKAEKDLNLEQLANSIDQLIMETVNKEDPMIGGSIALVTSNQQLLVRGYGFSDRTLQKPFDAGKTIAMTASVSKVVTVTAFLQLLESGQVSLEQPVKDVVPDINIVNPYNEPVLIKHLLTHTAGFDDSSIALEAISQESLLTIKEQLQQKLPPVVWPPGKFYNYSNYGMVLLAYIIETVSGQPFNQYLEQNLFQKLSMESSSFDYKSRNPEQVMRRYKWKTDENDELFLDDSYGLKYTHQIGAAGFHTTSNDMATFLQMYLNSGRHNNHQILKESTIKEAFRPHFSYDKLLTRKQGLVWRNRKDFDIEYNYHSGDDTGIESLIIIIPKAGIGLFFVANSDEGSSLKFKIRDLILSEINKLHSEVTLPPNKSHDTNFLPLTSFEGAYQYMNDGQDSIEKLQSLFGDTYKVKATGNSLIINGNEYTHLQSGLFKRKSNGALIKFVEESGRHHFSLGYGTYRQLKWYELPSFHLMSILISLALMLITIIGWCIGIFRKNNFNRKPFGSFKMYLGGSGVFLIGFLTLFIVTTLDITMKFGVPSSFNLLFSLPLISLVLFALGLVKIPSQMFNNREGKLGKIIVVIYLLATICCFVIFYYYNLIGYNYP